MAASASTFPACSTAGAVDFDALFADDDDPWRFRTRWYEERKRDITLACLPARHYASIFEPGCANGELSAALAPRCDRLLICDGSTNAIAVARQRMAGWTHAEVRQGWVPDAWPDERFDLIVISEIAYYLSTAQLDMLAAKTRAAMNPGGAVLACHWRRSIEGCAMDGDAVQQRLHTQLAMPCLTEVVEADFRLNVWSADARSVAQTEGLV